MMRIALVGHGSWGTRIEETISGIPGVEVIKVTRGELPPEEISGAIIATPGSTHAEVALPYTKRGLPVFIEKPMTIAVTDALRLARVAKEHESTVFVGHLYLFHGAFRSLQNALSDMGRVKRMAFTGHSTTMREDSSPLWDWLPHGLSLARAVFKGEPSSVKVSNKSAHEQEGTYFFDDIPFDFSVAWNREQKQMRFTVMTEQGELIFDDVREEKITRIIDGQVTPLPYDDTPPLTNEMSSFLNVVRGTEDIPRGARIPDGVNIVREIQGAETSARLQREVPLLKESVEE